MTGLWGKHLLLVAIAFLLAAMTVCLMATTILAPSSPTIGLTNVG